MQPENATARSWDGGHRSKGETLGYPFVMRPSYVLGGRGMEIIRDQAHLERYIANDRRDRRRTTPSCSTTTSRAPPKWMWTPSADGETVFVAGRDGAYRGGRGAFGRQRLLPPPLLAHAPTPSLNSSARPRPWRGR